MGQTAIASMTTDEFFAWQETQDPLYELIDGVPVQRVPGTRRHDRIMVNIIAETGSRLRGKTCSPVTQDTAIRISAMQIRRSDVAIDCGPFLDEEFIASDPRAVFEVLSPSTRVFDHSKKLEEYKSVASLRHILLIDGDSPEVIAYARNADGIWAARTVAGLEAVLDFPDMGFSLPMTEIYRDLTFRPRPILVMPDAQASHPAKAGEIDDDFFVDRALERDHQARQFRHRHPAPAVEFRLLAAGWAFDVDFGLRPVKTEGKPHLPLAVIAAFPGFLIDIDR